MNFTNVNFLIVIIATLSAFVLGGLWYSPILFAKPWMRENGFTDESMKNNKGNLGIIFGATFILAFIAALILAKYLGAGSGGLFGARWGAIFGAVVVVCVGTHYLFERKSLKLFLINAGYSFLKLVIMGAIIGKWQ